MKNIYYYFFVFIFVCIAQTVLAQLVTPNEDVCPNETVEYIIDSDYYGYQEFKVVNGVFIVDDSLHCTTTDSTNICMTVNSSNDTIKIKWGDADHLGILRLKQQVTWIDQEFGIGIVEPPAIATEKNIEILNGTQYFQVLLHGHKDITYEDQQSSNIQRTGVKKGESLGDYVGWTFSFKITGDQAGWIRFRTKSTYSQCPTIYSNWDSVFVYRKLNSPTFYSSKNLLCHNNQFQYSINPDSNAASYTWNVTADLEIMVNNNYYTTYTGNETSVVIRAKNFGSGERTISVKANGKTGYSDSEESIKKIWIDKPTADKINYYNVGPYYPGTNEICLDSPNDGKALYENSEADILEYEWDALDWLIVQHPSDPFPRPICKMFILLLLLMVIVQEIQFILPLGQETLVVGVNGNIQNWNWNV